MSSGGCARVRIGLVGYGRGGRFFHAPLIEQASDCALAGVVTRSPQRRAELAGDFPGVPAYDGLAGLAAAGVDAVVITAPVDTHEALVQGVITLGLPVVSDKPFTLDADSARAQGARSAGRVVTSTSDTGEPGRGSRVRATLRQPHFWKAFCAGVAAGRTVSVARSSGRFARMRSCRACAMPWRRQDARTTSSTRAKVRPGCSVVTSAGSGVVRSRHQEVDGRSGIPEA